MVLDVLHQEMCEFDGIHDVVFHVRKREREIGSDPVWSIQGQLTQKCLPQVDRQVFAAHKYVVLCRAPDTFGPWIESAEDTKNCYVDVDGLTATAFELILKVIYNNQLLSDSGTCIHTCYK